MCALIGISPNTLYSNLLQHKRDQLNHLISKIKKNVSPFNLSNQGYIGAANVNFNPVLANLDEFRKKNVTNLITLNSHRGRRIKQGFPAHGQRTRSNAKTAKRLNRSFAK
jgi:ribosomal protein S13